MSSTTTFSVHEVARHNSRDDLYMIIKGKVYNCTDFLSRHPGGEDVLEEVAGTDATEAYMDVGHSEEADKVLARYYIGSISDLKVNTSQLLGLPS
ncbi:outer mitochondrial membrane cytochrome B5 [Plectosphaerella plurivora]|uniref:Outer mitochondrial membrane cytochrome B5 n=1 Tax=Plectosphaerella plurivora TaxID=936078 RepID=A0A9P8V005_9PEZI|nr:outer mitochondrial membrane cytochrome B5 [Plectosphaerella plurivora]